MCRRSHMEGRRMRVSVEIEAEPGHQRSENRSSGYSRRVNCVGERTTVEISLDDYERFTEYQDAVNNGLNMIRSVEKLSRVQSGSLVTGKPGDGWQ